MPITTDLEWQQLALYAGGAVLLLIVIFNLPYVGRIFRALFSFALIGFCIFVLLRQAPFDPTLARLTASLGWSNQEVEGGEVRIRMSPDGHFWARVSVNGTERQMLVDSGATVTALSEETANAGGVARAVGVLPVVLRTANGAVTAQAGTVDRLEIGSIEARNLRVVISPALGSMDVLGMNFLSQLASWRVEGNTLVMTPASQTET